VRRYERIADKRVNGKHAQFLKSMRDRVDARNASAEFRMKADEVDAEIRMLQSSVVARNAS